MWTVYFKFYAVKKWSHLYFCVDMKKFPHNNCFKSCIIRSWMNSNFTRKCMNVLLFIDLFFFRLLAPFPLNSLFVLYRKEYRWHLKERLWMIICICLLLRQNPLKKYEFYHLFEWMNMTWVISLRFSLLFSCVDFHSLHLSLI